MARATPPFRKSPRGLASTTLEDFHSNTAAASEKRHPPHSGEAVPTVASTQTEFGLTAQRMPESSLARHFCVESDPPLQSYRVKCPLPSRSIDISGSASLKAWQ